MKNRAVTEIEAEQMFRYWRKVRENGGFTRVAAKFGRNRKTIHAMANKYDWPGRDKNIKDAVRDDQEKKEIRSAVRLADICKGLSDQVIRRIKAALKDGTYQPTIGEWIQLVRLHNEMCGDMPAAGVAINIGAVSADEMEQFDGEVGTIISILKSR